MQAKLLGLPSGVILHCRQAEALQEIDGNALLGGSARRAPARVSLVRACRELGVTPFADVVANRKVNNGLRALDRSGWVLF